MVKTPAFTMHHIALSIWYYLRHSRPAIPLTDRRFHCPEEPPHLLRSVFAASIVALAGCAFVVLVLGPLP